MAGRGGYQAPAHPAPVSGPGALSQRTDGGPAQAMSAPTGMAYGQHKAMIDSQRAAPMAGQTPLPTPSHAAPEKPSVPQMPAFSGTGFDAPTQRPGEAVTAGAGYGPGPGPEALTGGINPARGTGAMTQLL